MSASRLIAIAIGSALIGFGVSRVTAQEATPLVPTSEEFIDRAAIAGIYEVKAARVALAKGQDARLRAFAAAMIQDHTKAGEELKAVAGHHPVPVALDGIHASLIERLTDASPEEFDALYWRQQSEAHKDAVSLFTLFAVSGDNGAVKGFAAKTLPMLQHHQEMLGELKPSAEP